MTKRTQTDIANEATDSIVGHDKKTNVKVTAVSPYAESGKKVTTQDIVSGLLARIAWCVKNDRPGEEIAKTIEIMQRHCQDAADSEINDEWYRRLMDDLDDDDLHGRPVRRTS